MSSIPLNMRFGHELVEELDSARGSEGRSTFVKRALIAYLRQLKIANMCEWGKKTAQRDTAFAEELMVADATIPE